MKSIFVLRIRLLFGLFAFVALLLITRLYFLQVVHVDTYRDVAEGQYSRKSVAQERGDIFFQDKEGNLVTGASMQAGYIVALQPKIISDPSGVYERISSVIRIDQERFSEAASKKDDPYEEIANRVNEKDAAQIRDMKLTGVSLVRERWRVYPGDESASHILGFVGFKGDRREGRYGIEQFWEKTLARRPQGNTNFFVELFSHASDVLSEGNEGEGDVVTTIELVVQKQLEKTLADISRQYTPKAVGGIVMNPKTGAIVAMASRPTFNPNTYNEVTSQSVFVNPLIEGVYEMGSIMKPITMAIGLDTKAVTRKTHYEDMGCITRSSARICNFDLKARGVVDMQEVLSQSLNTGATFVAEKVGPDSFKEHVEAFGVGGETGVDLPNEAAGILSGLESGSAVDLASASFGQGIAVTPIAMIRALSVLANKGVLPNPHVVDHIRYPTGLTKKTWAMGDKRIISEEAAEEITNMLIEVVDTALLKGSLKQPHLSIAAKTGTAQIAESGAGYSRDRFLHSFFGYFPAHDPQFIVFLYTREPQGVEFASQSLATPFMDFTKFLVNYYDIPPDR